MGHWEHGNFSNATTTFREAKGSFWLRKLGKKGKPRDKTEISRQKDFTLPWIGQTAEKEKIYFPCSSYCFPSSVLKHSCKSFLHTALHQRWGLILFKTKSCPKVMTCERHIATARNLVKPFLRNYLVVLSNAFTVFRMPVVTAVLWG